MSVSQAKNNLQAQLVTQALAELARVSEQARQEYEGALKAYDASVAFHSGGAVLIADEVLAGKTPDPGWVERYGKSRNSVDLARIIMHQKYTRYSQISDQLLQEMQKPPAVAPAEGGETNFQNGK